MIVTKNSEKFNQSDYLSSVCHEFKTPVSAIISMASLLKEMLEDSKNKEKDGQEINFCVEEISKTAEDLLELTNDFLDVNDGKNPVFNVDLSKKIDIKDSIERSIRINQDFALKKNIDISFHIDKSVEKINLDEKRLKQILSNLISNSVKYSPNSTEIYVDAHKISKIDSSGAGHYLEISVSDQGFGMDQDQIDVAFSKYGVVSNENQGKVDSFGMGLAIVKKLVELQNGEIDVISEVGVGSVIKIKFKY